MSLPLEEILKKATISFPWRLTIGQSIGLIKYIEKKLRMERNISFVIDYSFKHSIKSGLQYGFSVPMEDEKASEPDGTMTLSNPPFVSSKFQLRHSEDGLHTENLQFMLPNDFENIPYNSELLQLWDDVKWVIDNYFEENQQDYEISRK